MSWFEERGIKKGDPASLKEDLGASMMRKVLTQREGNALTGSQLMERRLKKSLVVGT
jgi:hypothetical protein